MPPPPVLYPYTPVPLAGSQVLMVAMTSGLRVSVFSGMGLSVRIMSRALGSRLAERRVPMEVTRAFLSGIICNQHQRMRLYCAPTIFFGG
jgi:hypothetical protein